MTITTITNEAKRGCGYRKPGGLYMMAGGVMAPCGKLPQELTVCPCCHAGIKPARGWTWIDPRPLFAEKPCELRKAGEVACQCILYSANLPERMGLLWIGEKFYPTPEDFTKEAYAQGVSRRITAVPKDFEVGKTWVAFAHRKGILVAGDKLPDEPDLFLQAIVGVFRPTHIEYCVKEDDSEEKLEAMEKRGITLVRLVRTDGQPELEVNDEELHDQGVDG